MNFLKVLIQVISIYRAVSIFVFMMFHTVMPNEISSLILITAVSSDLLDGYLARKFKLTTTGGRLLDLFSDKYLNCISIIFLIVEGYPLLPLIAILTKEIFVLSFRSIEVNGEFLISTNRTWGGLMTGILWWCVFAHVNQIFPPSIIYITIMLGIANFIYLIYKIVANASKLVEAFRK